MPKDPTELRDVLVSSVQTLGEKADDMRGRIPDLWPDGATTVVDHLADTVHDARSKVSSLAKDASSPAADRRMKAVGILLVLSFVVILGRRRQQRRQRRSESS